MPEQQEQPAEHRCGYCGIAERQQVALEHAARFARAVVLPDKARAGDVKRVHHGVDEVIHIARRGVALDDDGTERIDARLNEEVCDREDRVLQTCRHADRQRVDGLVLVEAQLLHIQSVDVLAACERENDESRGNTLGDHARKRHAVGRHAEADDEHEVEDNIQHACGGEVDERRFRVADGAQNAAAVVVERGGGHAEEVNAQVELGAVDEVLARVEKLKERTGKDKPEREHQKACDQAHEERRVDGLAHILFVARAEVRGDEHVGAAAKTHQKAREQENERCGRADRAHGGRA